MIKKLFLSLLILNSYTTSILSANIFFNNIDSALEEQNSLLNFENLPNLILNNPISFDEDLDKVLMDLQDNSDTIKQESPEPSFTIKNPLHTRKKKHKDTEEIDPTYLPYQTKRSKKNSRKIINTSYSYPFAHDTFTGTQTPSFNHMLYTTHPTQLLMQTNNTSYDTPSPLPTSPNTQETKRTTYEEIVASITLATKFDETTQKTTVKNYTKPHNKKVVSQSDPIPCPMLDCPESNIPSVLTKHCFNNHIKIEELYGKSYYLCTLCKINNTHQKQYQTQHINDMHKHVQYHTSDTPFSCHICTFKTTIKGHLKTHLTKKHDVKTHTSYTKQYSPRNYCFINQEYEYPCPTPITNNCTVVGTPSQLTSHCIESHIKTEEINKQKWHTCSICTDDPYKCSDLGHMRRHMMYHTKHKPHMCTRCNYQASTAYFLKIHKERLHISQTTSEHDQTISPTHSEQPDNFQ